MKQSRKSWSSRHAQRHIRDPIPSVTWSTEQTPIKKRKPFREKKKRKTEQTGKNERENKQKKSKGKKKEKQLVLYIDGIRYYDILQPSAYKKYSENLVHRERLNVPRIRKPVP